jgi:hypothetical protein
MVTARTSLIADYARRRNHAVEAMCAIDGARLVGKAEARVRFLELVGRGWPTALPREHSQRRARACSREVRASRPAACRRARKVVSAGIVMSSEDTQPGMVMIDDLGEAADPTPVLC